MSGASDTALLTVVFGGWKQFIEDYKKNKDMEDAVKKQEQAMAEYLKKKKDDAKGVMGRVNEQVDLNIMLRHFCAWALDAKLERIMKHYNGKMESKKNQLHSVQHL